MKNRSIHIVIATSLFSFLLWFSVSMTEQYQVQVSAPLVVESVPAGKAIGTPLPHEVRFTFHDYGWRLFKLMWGTRPAWVLDLGSVPLRPLTVRDIGGQISDKIGAQPVSMQPESLYITLDERDTRRVPLVADIAATFRDGYGQIGGIVLKPDSVLITGAKRILSGISSWPTQRLTFTDVRKPITADVAVSDSIPNLQFTPHTVALSMDVQPIAEKTFAGIPIILSSVPQNRDVILSTSTLDIVVRGGIDQLARINQRAFRATLDYRVLLEDSTGLVQPELIGPKDIQIVRRTPDRINYVVRKN